MSRHTSIEGRNSEMGDNTEERRQGLPAIDQRAPNGADHGVLPPADPRDLLPAGHLPRAPAWNQRQPIRDDEAFRAARRDDFLEELEREYFGNGDQNRQPARDPNRTMRGMTTPAITESPWCIRLGPDAEFIEIGSGLIHHLPKFGGMSDENPMKHLKEFHGVCMSMKPPRVPEEDYKLKAFPFSLVDDAKSWLMSLPSGSIYSWNQLARKFMDKYYSHAKAVQARKELTIFKQERGESLYEYLERFRKLEASCPNHGISQRMLLEYFMDGMILNERRMLDASAQGSILDMYPEEIWELIEKKAESTRYLEDTRRTVPVANVGVQSEIQELKEMVAKLVAAQLPTESKEDVNAVGGWQNNNNKWPPRQNEGNWQKNNPQSSAQPYRHPNAREEKDDLAEIKDSMKKMTVMMEKLVQRSDKHEGDIQELKKHMSQVSGAVFESNDPNGRLPSQTIQNPRLNVSIVTIHGEEKPEAESKADKSSTDASTLSPAEGSTITQIVKASAEEIHKASADQSQAKIDHDLSDSLFFSPLQVIEQREHTVVDAQRKEIGEPVEQQKSQSDATREGAELAKSKDPGAFTVTCKIGKHVIHHCLIDLGAGVNVMPHSIYSTLNLGPLKPPKLTLEFADASSTRPVGLLEGLTLRVGEISVSADFYVLQMGDSRNQKPPSLILGRPFLKATRAKIDVATGELELASNDKSCTFYMYEDANRMTKRKPPDIARSLKPDKASANMVQVAEQGGSQPTFRGARGKAGGQYWKNQPPDAMRGVDYVLSEERNVLWSPELREGRVVGKFDHTFPWDPNW